MKKLKFTRKFPQANDCFDGEQGGCRVRIDHFRNVVNIAVYENGKLFNSYQMTLSELASIIEVNATPV